jgi:hypothetical protein
MFREARRLVNLKRLNFKQQLVGSASGDPPASGVIKMEKIQ